MSANFVLPSTFRAVGVAKRFFLRLTTAFFIVLRCHYVSRGSVLTIILPPPLF